MATENEQPPDEYGRHGVVGATTPAARLLAPLVWIAMGVIAVLTFVDVVGRYGFGAPVKGAFEIIEILMGITIFAGLPIVTAQREHIAVGLFDDWLNRRPSFARLRRLLVDLIAAIGAVGFTWFVGAQALEMFRYGNTAPFLEWPLAPFVAFMCLMCAATGAILLAQLVRTLRGR